MRRYIAIVLSTLPMLCFILPVISAALPTRETAPTVSKEATEATTSMVFEQVTEPTETTTTELSEPVIVQTEPATPTTEPSTEPVEAPSKAPQKATKPTYNSVSTGTKAENKKPATQDEATDYGVRSLGKFKLTAYCSCKKCCGKYAANRPIDKNGNEIVYGSTGIRLKAGVSIAVDPKVIPYGTKVVINGHTYVAQDTGGSIKGKRIDVYFDNHQEALDFGVKKVEVFVCI